MVHKTLKAANAQAPCQARRRSTGSVASRRSDPPTNSPYPLWGRGPSAGRARQRITAKQTMRAAENQ